MSVTCARTLGLEMDQASFTLFPPALVEPSRQVMERSWVPTQSLYVFLWIRSCSVSVFLVLLDHT